MEGSGRGIKEDALTEAAAVLMKCVPLADNLICVFERRFPTDVLIILFTTSNAKSSCKQCNCASPSAATVPRPRPPLFRIERSPCFTTVVSIVQTFPVVTRIGLERVPEIYRKINFHVYTEKSNFSYPLHPPPPQQTIILNRFLISRYKLREITSERN